MKGVVMANVRLTRVRLEAIGKDASEVSLFLAEEAGSVKGRFGGQWEEEEPGINTIPSSTGGTWGRLTIRRKDGA